MFHKVLILLVSLAITSIISAHEIDGSEVTGANLKKPEYYENFGGDFSLTGPEGKQFPWKIFGTKQYLFILVILFVRMFAQ